MRKYRFYKEWDYTDNNPNYNWFIDLKFFPFNKGWLSMVHGADELLDKLSGGKDEVTLIIDTAPFPYTDGCLERDLKLGLLWGAVYNAKGIEIEHSMFTTEETRSQLWLCPATLWVFLRYPKKIYYKVDHTKIDELPYKRALGFHWVFGKEGTLADLSIV